MSTCSHQPELLAAVLAEHGHDAAHDGPDSLVVAGSTQEAIGQLAFDHGVVAMSASGAALMLLAMVVAWRTLRGVR